MSQNQTLRLISFYPFTQWSSRPEPINFTSLHLDHRSEHIKLSFVRFILCSVGKTLVQHLNSTKNGYGLETGTASYILAIGSGQRLLCPSIRVRTALLYRLGSGLGLVLVLVLRCNAIAHTVLHVSPKKISK